MAPLPTRLSKTFEAAHSAIWLRKYFLSLPCNVLTYNTRAKHMNPVERNAWLAKEILVHEGVLRGYLSKFLKSVVDIEDVLQETYARLLSLNDASLAAVHNWHAFLFTSARNAALDRLRKNRVVSLDALAEMGSTDVLDQAPSAEEGLNTRQELALLMDAIGSLPDRCREVLTLRKLYGLSQREIAQRLAIAESTVEKHVAHGVRLCAERMFAKREQTIKPKAAKEMTARKTEFDGQ
jgi:RNA polymerase sigma factor (sigma-70 family)